MSKIWSKLNDIFTCVMRKTEEMKPFMKLIHFSGTLGEAAKFKSRDVYYNVSNLKLQGPTKRL